MINFVIMYKKVLLLTLLLIAFVIDSQAQCSMCRSVAESEADNVTAGLNNGILYLMGIPYILMLGVAVLMYRKVARR